MSSLCPKSRHISSALAAIAIVAYLSAAPPLRAGEGIITVNQHLTDDASVGDCVTPPSCDASAQYVTLPLNDLGQSSYLAGNAYHVGSQCQVAQARCFYDPYSKTKILSSDAGGSTANDVHLWIGQIRQSPHQAGQIHFEHYDNCLEVWADAGNAVSDLAQPTPQQCVDLSLPRYSPLDMLIWIRDSSGASVADTMLLQNGYLHVTDGTRRKLRWKVFDSSVGSFTDNPKRLVGSGYMGALAAPPERLNILAYFPVLRSHNSHLIRVWAIEQWVAQAPAATKGPTPFPGTLQAQDYDLSADNPAFFNRLRDFAQQAADRGIVVQLSLFDKHGLICPDPLNQHLHRYSESPYWKANNTTINPEFLPDATCTCTHGFGPAPDEPDVIDCQPTLDFVNPANYPELQGYHARYLERVGEEAGGIGNTIYEIINEALAPHDSPRYTPGDWPEPAGTGTTWNQQWQMDMAKRMRLSLPLANSTSNLNVARDAFNGDSNGTLLSNKVSDVESAPWSANNVRVKLPTTGGTETGGLGPSRTLGYATSNSETSKSSMSASLPFSSTSAWTKMQVRADLTVASGKATIGFSNGGSYTLYVTLDVPSSQLKLQQVGGCPILAPLCTLGTAMIDSPTSTHNVRLKVEQDVNPAYWHVSVFLDGAPVGGLQDITTGPFGTVAAVIFNGSNGSTPYLVDAAKIDNFEAARFCDDENRGCTP